MRGDREWGGVGEGREAKSYPHSVQNKLMGLIWPQPAATSAGVDRETKQAV